MIGGFLEKLGSGDFGFGGDHDLEERIHRRRFLLGRCPATFRQEGLASKGHGGQGRLAHGFVAFDPLFHHQEIGVEFAVALAGDEFHLEAGGQVPGKKAPGGLLAGAIAIA